MLKREEKQETQKQALLRGRSRQPRVFRPRNEYMSESVVISERNPDQYFIEIAGLNQEALKDINQAIIDGVALASVNRIKVDLGIQQEELLNYLDISSATFNRRVRAESKLTSKESGRVYRYARLISLATNLFHGNKEEAKRWLKTPAYAFKGDTPLAHARTEYGNNEVETLIGRIEHGIPS